MSTRHLRSFFRPRSIVVVGASARRENMGTVVLRNLLRAKFEGDLFAVNQRGYDDVLGVKCFSKPSKLPAVPQLAIICTAPATVPRLIRQLGKRGVRAVLVLVGGLSRTRSRTGRPLKESAIAAAREYQMRLMGPNSLGILVPGHHMNASYAHLETKVGEVAYVGQSGIMGSAMIDWAHGRGIGFSHFCTLGDSVDVEITDIIDYLAGDHRTKTILLHIERITSAQTFISAVRAASRTKLVLAIKSARVPQSQDVEQTPPAGVLDGDEVYDAVFHRAGVLRVHSTDELFDALATLNHMRPLRGERLAIITNGVGPGVLATDRLIREGGRLADLSVETTEALAKILPAFWTHRNPVDVSADAGPERYARVVECVGRDPGVDALLVMHVPTLIAPPLEVAHAVIEAGRKINRNLLTSWIGMTSVRESRAAFDAAGVPNYFTPDKAVRAFLHMVQHRRHQEVLMETPPALTDKSVLDRVGAARVVEAVANTDRRYLMPYEVRDLLTHFDIPFAETHYAESVEGIQAGAERFGYPVALKVIHEANCHPFAYGRGTGQRWRGVALGIDGPQRLKGIAERMKRRAGERYTTGRTLGFAVQPMRSGMGFIQLNVGVTRDDIFGPLVLFGEGGAVSSVLSDRRIAMPPLNIALARDLVRSAHVYNLIEDFGPDRQRLLDELCKVLVHLSQLVIDNPTIRGLEINPLLMNRSGVLALDAAVDLGSPCPSVIQAYPEELREMVELKNGREVILRPIRGEDEPAHAEFAGKLSPESIRYRFFGPRTHIGHMELARLTQIDYHREMAFIASSKRPGRLGHETLGVVRMWIDADNISGEFAVIVRDDLKGLGLGRILMEKIIRYATHRGLLIMVGTVLPENEPMLRLAEKMDFERTYNQEDGLIEVRRVLNQPANDWQRARMEAR